MRRLWVRFAAGLVLLPFAAAPLRAGPREVRTVEEATETLRVLADIPLRGIPQGLLRDCQGVAVIPGVVRAGFVVDGRFGRGVVLARQADGTWSNPVFITLAGGGVGWQIGVESTDVVLVFETRGSLDRILRGKGKLTLGGDVSVAAGPLGREAAAGTDGRLRAEIYSYSRSRGLFAGLALEGAGLLIDRRANEAFYGFPAARPGGDYATPRGLAVAEALRGQLARLTAPPAPPVLLLPAPAPPAPPPQAPPPALLVPTQPPPPAAPLPPAGPPPPVPVPVPAR